MYLKPFSFPLVRAIQKSFLLASVRLSLKYIRGWESSRGMDLKLPRVDIQVSFNGTEEKRIRIGGIDPVLAGRR